MLRSDQEETFNSAHKLHDLADNESSSSISFPCMCYEVCKSQGWNSAPKTELGISAIVQAESTESEMLHWWANVLSRSTS